MEQKVAYNYGEKRKKKRLADFFLVIHVCSVTFLNKLPLDTKKTALNWAAKIGQQRLFKTCTNWVCQPPGPDCELHTDSPDPIRPSTIITRVLQH